MRKELQAKIAAIEADCVECGACAEGCHILTELDESPLALAGRELTAQEAFSCSLCHLCESVCPQELDPSALFAAARRRAVVQGEVERDEYAYLLPDRPNGNSVYRDCQQIDYNDLKQAGDGAKRIFFPGCTLMTYGADLLRETMAQLAKAGGPVGFSEDCCGKPLRQMGLDGRAEKYEQAVVTRLRESGVEELIVACPGCYYTLKKLLQDEPVRIVTVYERLGAPRPVAQPTVCTIQDTCPDRFENIFYHQVRDCLRAAGYQVREMEHSGAETRCCGSGGQVSHFRPDIRELLLASRLEEARGADAGLLVSPCLSCVLNLGDRSDGAPVRHALNLLLGLDEDYNEVKTRSASLFDSEEGMLRWYEMMAAPDPEE